MKKTVFMAAVAVLFALIALFASTGIAADAKKSCDNDEKGWVSIFDGKTLTGWKASERPESFRVEDGAIVVNGSRAHLFYVGPLKNHDFKNFEFKADVMTMPKANSGIYIHTRYQDKGWPDWGYEVQVNHSHGDPKKSGGLYDIKDVFESPAKDNVWLCYNIIVRGKRIIVKVDGKKVVDFTEPDNFKPPKNHPLRKLTHGTFALQAHDPVSKVLFKNIKVKPLDD
ncbi:MAG: DUF1080 domain-containing protein [Pirellulales bacterium]|nr:DUF1080 domain-containing protein [Pirellulales bacterium]